MRVRTRGREVGSRENCKQEPETAGERCSKAMTMILLLATFGTFLVVERYSTKRAPRYGL